MKRPLLAIGAVGIAIAGLVGTGASSLSAAAGGSERRVAEAESFVRRIGTAGVGQGGCQLYRRKLRQVQRGIHKLDRFNDPRLLKTKVRLALLETQLEEQLQDCLRPQVAEHSPVGVPASAARIPSAVLVGSSAESGGDDEADISRVESSSERDSEEAETEPSAARLADYRDDEDEDRDREKPRDSEDERD